MRNFQGIIFILIWIYWKILNIYSGFTTSILFPTKNNLLRKPFSFWFSEADTSLFQHFWILEIYHLYLCFARLVTKRAKRDYNSSKEFTSLNNRSLQNCKRYSTTNNEFSLAATQTTSEISRKFLKK